MSAALDKYTDEDTKLIQQMRDDDRAAALVDGPLSQRLLVAYALARGLSLNLGLNYSDANVVRNQVIILTPNTKSATATLRYGF